MYVTLPEAKATRKGKLMYIQRRRKKVNYQVKPLEKVFNLAIDINSSFIFRNDLTRFTKRVICLRKDFFVKKTYNNFTYIL